MSTRVLAIALVVIGAAILAYPAISYTTTEKVVDMGPLQVTADKENTIQLPKILGGAAVGVGLILLVVGRRK